MPTYSKLPSPGQVSYPNTIHARTASNRLAEFTKAAEFQADPQFPGDISWAFFFHPPSLRKELVYYRRYPKVTLSVSHYHAEPIDWTALLIPSFRRKNWSVGWWSFMMGLEIRAYLSPPISLPERSDPPVPVPPEFKAHLSSRVQSAVHEAVMATKLRLRLDGMPKVLPAPPPVPHRGFSLDL
jgi:hypothetical protein